MKPNGSVLSAIVLTCVLLFSAGCSATPETPAAPPDPFVGEYVVDEGMFFTLTEDHKIIWLRYKNEGYVSTWEKISETEAKFLLPNIRQDAVTECTINIETGVVKWGNAPIYTEKTPTYTPPSTPKSMVGSWHLIGGYSFIDGSFKKDILDYDLVIHIYKDGTSNIEVIDYNKEWDDDDIGGALQIVPFSKWYLYNNRLLLESTPKDGYSYVLGLNIDGDYLSLIADGDILCFEK